MRFAIHDLRDFRNSSAQTMMVLVFNSNKDAAIIVIGHGNAEGTTTCGTKEELIPHNHYLKVLWLYSCNSAKCIAKSLSRRGMITLGFITEVIAPVGSSRGEIKTAQEAVSGLEEIVPAGLFKCLREGFFKSAKSFLDDKKLLNAAIVNHTRLSLRLFSESKHAE